MVKIKFSHLLLVLLVLLFISFNASAGKIKGIDDKSEVLEKAFTEVETDIDNFVNQLKEINKPGSFIKTDFYGLPPRWYKDDKSLETNYPIQIPKERIIRDVMLIGHYNRHWESVKVEFWYAKLKNSPKDKKYNRIYRGKHKNKALEEAFIKDGVKGKYIAEAVKKYEAKSKKIDLLLHNRIVTKFNEYSTPHCPDQFSLSFKI